MTNPMIRIHNVTTGEVVDREMTNEEVEAELNPPAPPARHEA